MLQMNKKLVPLLSMGLAFYGFGVSTPSMAGDHPHAGKKHHQGQHHQNDHHHGNGHHHHQPAPPQHHKHHDHTGRNIAIGLGAAALVGAIAIASANSGTPVYHQAPPIRHCRRVVTEQRCHTNEWGDYICRNIRYVRHVC